jgi:hypothetical protein
MSLLLNNGRTVDLVSSSSGTRTLKFEFKVGS